MVTLYLPESKYIPQQVLRCSRCGAAFASIKRPKAAYCIICPVCGESTIVPGSSKDATANRDYSMSQVKYV